MSDSWEVEITHDGDWPFRWRWIVTHIAPGYHYSFRNGAARTEDRARRQAVKARADMEKDVLVIDNA